MPTENETISLPSYNPAEAKDLAGVLKFSANTIKKQIEKVAPAKILKYDRKTNRATVQILNYSIASTGEKLPRQPIADIPVSIFGGGGFCLGFPIKEGDIGLLIAADGNISVFKKLLQMFTPATYEKHRYEDGIFFPLILNGQIFSSTDENNLLISSIDGTTKISMSEEKITITAPQTIVDGDLKVNGTVTSSVDVLSAGISGKSHTHTGVQTGTGNTGAPQ